MRIDEENRLENIARRVNEQGNSSLTDRIKRISYIPLAVYYGGVLRREYQKGFAEKISWKEKNLTISNALIFGLGASAVYYSGAETVFSFENIQFLKNLKHDIVSEIATFLGTTSKNVLYGYAWFNLMQSCFRVAYAQITRKLIASFCVSSVFLNAAHSRVSRLLKKRKAKSP